MKMLWILSGLLLILTLTGAPINAQTVTISSGPQIVFDKETHDFGEVFMYGDGNCVFKFSNTGNEPLILTDVRAGCGCTVPEWPREPLLPGDTATIRVRYTTLNRVHQINRSIVVTSNAKNKPTQVLRLIGNVIAPPDEVTPGTKVEPINTPALR